MHFKSVGTMFFQQLLKRLSDIWAIFAHLTQNFTRNSMVAIIFVKNLRLRNGGLFKIEPPENRDAIWDQTVSLIKMVKKTDPHYIFNFGGGLFSWPFWLYSPFGHKLHFKIEPPPHLNLRLRGLYFEMQFVTKLWV